MHLGDYSATYKRVSLALCAWGTPLLPIYWRRRPMSEGQKNYGEAQDHSKQEQCRRSKGQIETRYCIRFAQPCCCKRLQRKFISPKLTDRRGCISMSSQNKDANKTPQQRLADMSDRSKLILTVLVIVCAAALFLELLLSVSGTILGRQPQAQSERKRRKREKQKNDNRPLR